MWPVKQARSQVDCAPAGAVAPAARAASATTLDQLLKRRARGLLRIRLEPNDVARLTRELVVDGDVDEAVRTLAHIAGSVFARQQRLAARDDVAVQREPNQLTVVTRHAPGERVTAPIRE